MWTRPISLKLRHLPTLLRPRTGALRQGPLPPSLTRYGLRRFWFAKPFGVEDTFRAQILTLMHSARYILWWVWLLLPWRANAVAPAGDSGLQAGFITSLRHEGLLKESRRALLQASEAVRNRIPHEMLLLDCYAALRALDELTGATTADDILNRIFSTFCIGK